nr:hypothetical protein [Tanacetum cinerariifolium]
VASDDLRDALSVLYLTSAHLRSIGIDIPVRVIIYHRYQTYIMLRVGYCGLEHPQGQDLIFCYDPIWGCYIKATTDQLGWVNPEGQQYPHNLLKPLPLIPNNQGRRVIPFEHFINNDLEYLHGGASSRKYTTSITKTKAADYGHIKGVIVSNSMVLPLIGSLLAMYILKEESSLSLNSSYQKKLNLTKPDLYRSDLKRKEAYTAYSNPQGFIYQNKDKKNSLMRIDELHKFSDRTLTDVRTALDDHLKGIRMQYLSQSIWRKSDKDRAAAMIQAIDKRLKTKRITRSLERFVGRRLYEGDFRMLQRTI